jgi:uncharacterized protein (DUF1697 family)
MQYVALLRGINVGGNNRVEMSRLKSVCESLGWANVSTYINSGNAIFSHDEASPAVLAAELARALHITFGFAINVLVKTGCELAEVITATPESWTNGPSMKCDVVFVWDSISIEEELKRLKPRVGIDEVRTTPSAIIWKVDRVNAARSGLLRIVGTPLYRQVTVRNITTVRKLGERINARET